MGATTARAFRMITHSITDVHRHASFDVKYPQEKREKLEFLLFDLWVRLQRDTFNNHKQAQGRSKEKLCAPVSPVSPVDLLVRMQRDTFSNQKQTGVGEKERKVMCSRFSSFSCLIFWSECSGTPSATRNKQA
jgi:hypothetical protein